MKTKESLAGYADLKVVSPYDIRSITDIHINNRINEHASLTLTGIMAPEEKDHCISTSTDRDYIQVKQKIDGDQERILFQGMITNLTIRSIQDIYFIYIEALSYTSELDIKREFRSFQNEDMSYSELVESIIAKYPKANFISDVSDSTRLGAFTLQYNETDWQFLKRMASHLGAGLIPDSSADSPKFWLGLPDGKKTVPIECRNYNVKKNLSAYYEASESDDSWDLSDNEFISCEMESPQYFHIGDRVIFENRERIIFQSSVSMKDGILIYKYLIAPEHGLRQRKVINPSIAGISLTGSVVDVSASDVKIHLDIDKPQERDTTTCWFPYSSVYSAEGHTGWYCMPEIGDDVQLYFPSGHEEQAFVKSSIRKEEYDSTNLPDPTVKYFRTAYGKEMVLDNKALTLSTNKESNFITLHEQHGVKIHSHSTITLVSNEDIQLTTKNKITANAQEAIYLMCGSNSIILDGEADTLASSVHVDGTVKAPVVVDDDEADRAYQQMVNQYKKEKETKSSNWLLDSVQLGLNILGLIPVIGSPASLINGAMSMARSSYADGALCCAAALPLAGPMIKGVQLAKKATSIIPKAAKAAKGTNYGLHALHVQAAEQYAQEGDWINAARCAVGTIGLNMALTGSRQAVQNAYDNLGEYLNGQINNLKKSMDHARLAPQLATSHGSHVPGHDDPLPQANKQLQMSSRMKAWEQTYPSGRAVRTEGVKYTGGRTQKELDELAGAPFHGGRIREQGMKERDIGLDVERQGKLGEIIRDPQANGGAEFIDITTGIKWNVKSFESYPNGHTSPHKGAFTVRNGMKAINKELNKSHNVILDTRNMTPDHADQFKKAIQEAGMWDRMIWYP
ncbi:phage baseplate assembly protein V [Paenibacillus dendritiformis]|uniref:Gp5/Type VI secretion system Vgr protein OB-fold domain-containing protein n=1 Tax=Paenibacillus dendritiformis C454 TaxID=1131935 RepID=H3SJ63_9BACL|nr:contractile injection system protein, VgrG/Pvc8 family [Paenibacillus dendritiformis]EHQ60899.1 hypothetical protein PDENDC454_17943 [Paenibacillus dendritiformis C454]CAH8771856.1 phage baseplate assembly protein V [Paenibacillus dendritiformis]